MSLFAKAAKKASEKKSTGRPKKNTTWAVGDTKESEKVSTALKNYVKDSAELKTVTSRLSIAKKVIFNFAKKRHVADFAELGVPPDTPMLVQNQDGDTATFVVQDRSAQYPLKEEQLEKLIDLLGEDAARELVYEETSLKFNRMILAIPGVAEAIEAALEKCVTKMVKDGTLKEDAADDLILADVRTALKPGTVERSAQIAGKDVVKLGKLLDIFSSSCCRYVK